MLPRWFADVRLCKMICYYASLAQLAEHALRNRMVVSSISTGGFLCRPWALLGVQGHNCREPGRTLARLVGSEQQADDHIAVLILAVGEGA